MFLRNTRHRTNHQRQLGNHSRFRARSFGRGHCGRHGGDRQPDLPLPSAGRHDGQGKFELDNVPFNNYHLTVTASGFQTNVQDVSVRTPVPLDIKATLQVGTAYDHGEGGSGRGSGRKRAHHPHRRRSRAVRQATARKPVFVAQLAGDAGLARNRGRFQRPVPRTGRSRLELVFARRPADHRPAEQGLLEPDSGRRGAVHGSDRRRAAGRIRRQRPAWSSW